MSSTPIRLSSGLSSGLPVEDIISQLISVQRRPLDLLTQKKTKFAQQQTQYTNVKTRVDALLASIKKLTFDTSSVLSTATDPFQAKKAAISDDSVVKATVTSAAASQTIDLEVLSLATPTRASSLSNVAQYISAATPLNQAALGSLTTGNFTVFSNGTPYDIAVNAGETIGDVLGRINTVVPEITADPTITNGQVSLAFPDGVNIQLGASTDTSNFLTALKLNTGTRTDLPGADTEILSQAPVLAFNPSASLDGGTAGTVTPVTSGTFVINGKTFDVTGKSMNTIISEINGSGAKVNASFNPSTNKFELASTEPGSAFISLANGTSNFLSAVGIINGADTTSSQTVGNNAQIKVNGGAVLFSPTNTVSDSVTGLSGVTLNLSKAQPGTPVKINITQDTESLEASLDEFVGKFNELMTFIDQQTKSDQDATKRGVLNGESSLRRFKQEIRQLVLDQVPALSGSGYDSLQSIGISTGESTGVINTSTALKFDKTRFRAALAANPDAVRKIVNGKAATDGADGTLTRFEASLKSALGTVATTGSDGIFESYNTAATNRITALNETIKQGEERLSKREDSLRKQFLAMEKAIQQYQAQGSALTGLQNQLAAG